jgi:uncharacterized repeat protein (TIGR03803 family)
LKFPRPQPANESARVTQRATIRSRSLLFRNVLLLGFSILFPCVAKSGRLTTLHAFAAKPTNVRAGLVRATDGNYYGVSQGGGVYGSGTVFKLTAAGDVTTIHSFAGGSQGGQPASALTEGLDGMLYGSTSTGGANGWGTLFKISLSGELATLFSFAENGYDPTPLVLGSDGNLYGTTRGPFSSSNVASGTVFRISPNGVFTQFHAFSSGVYGGQGADGGYPGPLTRGSDGNFYGATNTGGEKGKGTFFRISEAGVFAVVHSFEEGSGLGTALVEAADGSFYGVARSGGTSVYYGFIYKITKSGQFTKVYDFTGGMDGSGGDEGGADTERGYATLCLGPDGNFYGTSPIGGTGATQSSHGYGIIFQLTPAGAFKTLHSFINDVDGSKPKFGLVRTGAGTFRGIASGLSGIGHPATAFDIAPDGTFATTHIFSPTDEGRLPAGAMVEDGAGNFYGVTRAGGSDDAGTIFRMDPSGKVTTLHEFIASSEGSSPNKLCLGRDGNLYGTTFTSGPGFSYGTVYKMTPAGVFTLLHSFDSDGIQFPFAPLVEGNTGEFYGTTESDSSVFRITSAGDFSIIHKFTGSAGGASVVAPVVWAGGETFYGTTTLGGTNNAGTVFRVTATGDFQTIYSFSGGADGGDPEGLVLGNDGTLYGFTSDEFGTYRSTIYKLTPGGVFTTLYTFPEESVAYSLFQAADGQFYGMATGVKGAVMGDGNSRDGNGFIFQMTSSGSLSSVHDFTGGADGKSPSGLMQGNDGNLYGSTGAGPGTNELGTIFKLGFASDLANISTRIRVQTGEGAMIGGFIVTGDAPKKVIIRALGPSLQAFGTNDVLADPRLELHSSDGSVIASNDNWEDTQKLEIEESTIPPPHALESAIVATLSPGAYTCVVQGTGGATGVGLVEIYDLIAIADSRLANISTRGFVDTGDSVMIGGLIVGEGAAGEMATVLVRALGPSLSNAGIHGALPDTTLSLRGANGAILAENDDWKDSQQTEIEATTVPPTDARESAIVFTLTPGNYTAIVRGKNDSTGVGLVEVYNLH